MTTLRKARAYLETAPRQAAEDIVGLVATAAIVVAAVNLPALF